MEEPRDNDRRQSWTRKADRESRSTCLATGACGAQASAAGLPVTVLFERDTTGTEFRINQE